MIIGQPENVGALHWNNGFGSRRSEQFQRAQRFIDSECIRLMVPYTPMLNGVLFRSATEGTVIGSGKIVYNAPYARYQYYGKLMVSSTTGSAYSRGEKKVLTGTDLQYNKSRHRLAGSLWFERMKADHKDEILRGAAHIAGGNAQ